MRTARSLSSDLGQLDFQMDCRHQSLVMDHSPVHSAPLLRQPYRIRYSLRDVFRSKMSHKRSLDDNLAADLNLLVSSWESSLDRLQRL